MTAAVVWDDRLVDYDFGPGHPFAPVRLELAMQLVRDLGLLDLPGVQEITPAVVPQHLLESVHDRDFIAAVQAEQPDLRFGIGTGDVPVFPQMHEVAMRVCGATLAAAQAVHSGSFTRAVNLGGGLHHAMRGSASGFCVYNDLAVAIAWLLEQGVDRVAYVDVDVHHGDGVQSIFYDDPRVLTVSIHESGRTLFPGTGWPDETGVDGTSVNVALPAGTADARWLRAFDAVVPDVLEAFRPQVLITQHGCDSHFLDPLANLELTVDAQRASYIRLAELADRHTDGRWIATGGGGYEWEQVVPRAWAHLVGVVAGAPLDPVAQIPQSWRDLAVERCGAPAPTTLTDGGVSTCADFDAGYDPADPVDAAVLATRRAVYPLLGIATWSTGES